MGEAAILSGVLLLAGQLRNVAFEDLHGGAAAAALAEGPARWLLLVGFAVKLGIVPLHLWLPLAAYPFCLAGTVTGRAAADNRVSGQG